MASIRLQAVRVTSTSAKEGENYAQFDTISVGRKNIKRKMVRVNCVSFFINPYIVHYARDDFERQLLTQHLLPQRVAEL